MGALEAMDTALQNGWEIHRYEFQGELAAFIVSKGSEVHATVINPRAVRRTALREFISELFDRLGFLTTRVPVEDGVSRIFVERIGFTKTWTDTVYDYYILTALPFER